MDTPEQQHEEVTERLARAEAQLRQIKILVIALIAVVIGLLVPPVRTLLDIAGSLLGFILILGGIPLAVLLFIAVVTYGLERLFSKRYRI